MYVIAITFVDCISDEDETLHDDGDDDQVVVET